VTNITTSSQDSSQTYNATTIDKSNEDSSSYETILYGAMGSLFIIFALKCVNDIYGPFFGIERSSSVLPEGEQLSPVSWSIMRVIHSILDIQDAYHAEVNSLNMNSIVLDLEGGAQQAVANGETDQVDEYSII